MMSKKDYERAAEMVRDEDDSDTRTLLTEVFVDFFHGDYNPRFDERRFRAACKREGE